MKKINRRYLQFERVKIVIFTIGKSANGEANVLLLLVNDKVEYSLIIDYCENSLELLKKYVIEKYNINYFDMICWTHPHVDHSKGLINILKKYACEKTKIVFPSELEIVAKCMNTTAREVYTYITKITERNQIKNGICKNATQGTELESIIFSNTKTTDEYAFNIYALSPISHRLLNLKNNCKHEINQKCLHNFNEYSILLIVNFNGTEFLFGADIENGSIRVIEKEIIFNNVVYTKIPHHGSNTSDKLIELFDTGSCNSMICTTTALLKQGKYGILPNRDVLNEYYDSFKNVFCTSSSYLNENVTDMESYGVIVSEFAMPISKKSDNIYANVELYGEAIKYIPY